MLVAAALAWEFARSRTGRRPLTQGRQVAKRVCLRASPSASSRTGRLGSPAPSLTGDMDRRRAQLTASSLVRCPRRTRSTECPSVPWCSPATISPVGRGDLQADLGVRRQDPGLEPQCPPRLRRGHRNRVLVAEQDRI